MISLARGLHQFAPTWASHSKQQGRFPQYIQIYCRVLYPLNGNIVKLEFWARQSWLGRRTNFGLSCPDVLRSDLPSRHTVDIPRARCYGGDHSHPVESVVSIENAQVAVNIICYILCERSPIQECLPIACLMDANLMSAFLPTKMPSRNNLSVKGR